MELVHYHYIYNIYVIYIYICDIYIYINVIYIYTKLDIVNPNYIGVRPIDKWGYAPQLTDQNDNQTGKMITLWCLMEWGSPF